MKSIRSITDEDLIELYLIKKKSIQADQYSVKEQSLKLALNSLYGCLSNNLFLFFDLRLAECITLTGQNFTKKVIEEVNKKINKILKTDNKDYAVASDTDSVYISLNELVKKVNKETEAEFETVKKIADKHLGKFIAETVKNFAQYLNFYDVSAMVMKRETLSDKSIFIAKKRYAMRVLNSEGVQYDEPMIKVQGLEIVRSTTPKLIQDWLKQCITVLFDGDEKSILKYRDEIKKVFFQSKPSDISLISSVQGLEKYYDENSLYKKGTPIHVRASLLYNNFILKNNLSDLELINNGDKIKYIYLMTPNGLGNENIIAFKGDDLPLQLSDKINNYIDYETMFQKSFLKPLNNLTTPLGYELEKPLNNLDDFF